MSEWVKDEESSEETWHNEDYGTIVKIDQKYHALIPQTFVLGGFSDLKEAQRQVLLNYDVLLKLTQNFTPEMLQYIERLRGEEQFEKELK